MRATEEDILGSWASITADLINFFRSNDLSIYSAPAYALDSIKDTDVEPTYITLTPSILVFAARMAMSSRTHAFLSDIPQVELEFSTSMVMGERIVEILCNYTPMEAPSRRKHIVLLYLRSLFDYATGPWKH
jgi:hypothetical protein